MKAFYKKNIHELFQTFQSGEQGLTSAEAEKRLNLYGLNSLPSGKKVSFLSVVVHQFKSPLIYILIAAGFVSLLIGEYEDSFFIFFVILVNASLGTYQEWKAEQSAAALQKLVKTRTRVLRDNVTVVVDSENLVPGDVILLESGMKVPADVRLFQANNLRADEAILTGESLPVEKQCINLPGDDLPLGDQVNMLFAGTTISAGRGKGLVVATSLNTEIGKIAETVAETRQEKTPLLKRMENFAKLVSLVVLAACLMIAMIGFFRGYSVSEIFFVSVAIAVAAIPEGLPVAMTVALSTGSSRMAKRNVIIRKLSAVEGLGSCNYIGTDKTGTLTVDQQTIKLLITGTGNTFEVTGVGYNGEGHIKGPEQEIIKSDSELDELVKAAVLCNEAELRLENKQWHHQGDAIDVAFLALAWKYGIEPDLLRKQVQIVREIPFESERKFAAAFYRDHDLQLKAAVKGAIEAVLPLCGDIDDGQFLKQADELASHGYRVLAIAGGNVSSSLELKGLTFLGLVALIDPLKPEAKQAIQFCHEAKIKVAMITGDHPTTALAIAKELDLATSSDQVITGDKLGLRQNEQDEEFHQRVQGKTVFARVNPLQKQQIVADMKAHGNFVAVTGDGVNDAPALKSADIGVAMGYGSDVAKEAASIIITDNNFASIAAGIEEGRYTYGNIRKIIYLLISTGTALIIMVMLSLLLDLPLPFLPVQLLWLNLVTNGLQDIAMAFEKGEKYLLKGPPRNYKEGIFDRLMITQTLTSASVMTVLTFGLWYHLLKHLHYEEAQARNIVLLLMVLLQNFHTLNCRSERFSFLTIPLRNNPFLLISIIAAQGLHIASMHIPVMQRILNVGPVTMDEWFKLLLTASSILVVMELFKIFHRKKVSYP